MARCAKVFPQRCPSVAQSGVGAGEQAEEVVDGDLCLQVVSKMGSAENLVSVPAAHLLLGEIALLHQFDHDLLDGALRDAHPFRDIADAGIGVLRQRHQHVSVVGEKRPMGLPHAPTIRELQFRFDMKLNTGNCFPVIWFRCASMLAVLALAMGLVALPAAWSGAEWTMVWRPLGVPLGIELDVLSSMLLGFVGLLGWVVSRYSATNLRGRRGARRAGIALFAAVASLTLTVTGASLVTIALGWTLSGFAVGSLVARAGTPEAASATRIMRRTLLVGDSMLWAGVVLALVVLPSTERSRLAGIETGWGTTLVALLLLGACVARTGLVPAHRWLPETTEAPSPVSALLHAGVVNGAGVLVLLAWPLFTAAPLALLLLLLLGAASVVMGSWASRVRSDVKGRLACSTTSQMGYMCIQLGLGLPVAAFLHLMGHGAYKSFLFLRAGGAVGRARAAVAARVDAPRRRWATVAVGSGLGLVVGLPATVRLLSASGVTALLPVLLAAFTAGLAGHAVAGLRRLTPALRRGLVVTAGLASGLYTWLLLGTEKLFATAWEPVALWGPGPGALLGVAVVGVCAAAWSGFRFLETHPTSSLAVFLMPTALPPMGIRRGRIATLTMAQEPSTALGAELVESTVELAAAIVGPAWPLRNFVAASTLAGLETLPFDDALLVAEQAHGVTPRPSMEYFLDLLELGRITPAHLDAALSDALPHDGGINRAKAFIHRSRLLVGAVPAHASGQAAPVSPARHFKRRCESLAGGASSAATSLVDVHSALWVQRAWPNTSALYDAENPHRVVAGPWAMWQAAATRRTYDRAVGVSGASAMAELLPNEPARAIATMAGWLGVPGDDLMGYLVATFASAPGWSGHAAWRANRLQTGDPLVELAALRMAHDVMFSLAATDRSEASGSWRVLVAQGSEGDREALALHLRVWQRALEISVEGWLVEDLVARARSNATAADDAQDRPSSQSLWCIDVRSERIRREMEAQGSHETFGFAGFFGASVEHIDADGIAHELCPALIRPAFRATEEPAALTVRQALYRTLTEVSKDPLGALLIAEVGGGMAAAASTLSTLAPLGMRGVFQSWTLRRPTGTSAVIGRPSLETTLTLAERVAMATTALAAPGITGHMAPVIMVCAHASSPENNAFATAYDCGACGGNGGVINAVLVADALNEPAVRSALLEQGLRVPEDTVAVAAVHDTTTDVVELLPVPGATSSQLRAIEALTADLAAAGARAAASRRHLLPSRGRVADSAPLMRRAADWSEPTPEWGLAGNAAILIGPRDLTTGVDLAGRVFLHSYDRDGDPDAGILEVLLTAPLVVAQWINAQYYFSAVAPSVFGAGDKTTHNVVGDIGVMRGAHGDLRTGLPWQALFHDEPGAAPDAVSLMHPPVRLLGIVVADPAAIVDIVTRHDGLGQLICNEWIRLVCIDRGQALRLRRDFTWEEC